MKEVELEALLDVPEGFGDDVPIDPDFHARRLPDSAWRKSELIEPVASVIQLHRLREVLALCGFSRLEPVTPDIHGEYEGDVEVAHSRLSRAGSLPLKTAGRESLFSSMAKQSMSWVERDAVKAGIDGLTSGFQLWADARKSQRGYSRAGHTSCCTPWRTCSSSRSR